VEEKELKLVTLDEITNLMWIIFIPLIVITLIFSIIEYGFFFWWEYMMFAGITVIFVVPVCCTILGISVKILSTLNLVKTDGRWGTLDIMKSFYFDLYDDEK
tara:strand:- start:72 stop:377 length:306 start_codon:yes stop_codon:yes gene_type:complete